MTTAATYSDNHHSNSPKSDEQSSRETLPLEASPSNAFRSGRTEAILPQLNLQFDRLRSFSVFW